MNSMLSHRLRALCAGAPLLLAVLAPPAHAQYSYAWIDAKGQRVYSDRPPPADTPPARILKSPHPRALSPYGQAVPAAAPAAPAPAPAPTPAAAAAKSSTPTLAERDADFRARAAKQQEVDRKAAEDAQKQAAQAERCKALKGQEMTLASGTRLSQFNAQGERGYMSDDERAQQLSQVRKTQSAECK